MNCYIFVTFFICREGMGESVVAVGEEARDVGKEYVGGTQGITLGDEFRKVDVGDEIVRLVGDELLVHAVEAQHVAHVGGGVADIHAQFDSGGVFGAALVIHLLVFVAVVVQASHDVGQDRRCRGQASRAFAEHKLAVVALSA